MARASDDAVSWSEPALRSYAGAVKRGANEAVASVLGPPDDTGPEDANGRTIAVSPGYDATPTVFVAAASSSRIRATADLRPSGCCAWSRWRVRW